MPGGTREDAPRAEDFIKLLVPTAWRPTLQQVLGAIRIAIVVTIILLTVLLILYLVGLLFGITVLKLLKVLAVPITIGAAVPWLNWLQKKRELAIERQGAQDEALQAYLDQVGQLLLYKDAPLRQSEEESEVRTLARARTLTVLSRLDSDRKAQVVQFLYEAGLIAKRRPILDLRGADLIRANLRRANLTRADLSGADLRGSDLSRANLLNADLSKAELSGAVLTQARLVGTNLIGATLIGADLHALRGGNPKLRGANLREVDLSRAILLGADLREANLSLADLSLADLSNADLNRADLSRAILRGAQGTTKDQLDRAATLRDATMPNGQKYEDWLKDREGR